MKQNAPQCSETLVRVEDRKESNMEIEGKGEGRREEERMNGGGMGTGENRDGE